ncbi:MAG: pirin family protein, partial [Myxococcota bacterium]
MSWTNATTPVCQTPECEPLARVVTGKPKDLGGGAMVLRSLPTARLRHVGPFVFLDHFGPNKIPAGGGVDIRPHPHINLATCSFLFAGGVLHQDSVGSRQVVEAGGVGWMNAGRGITHSERIPAHLQGVAFESHGLQAWIALPTDAEESEPSWQYIAPADVPTLQFGLLRCRLIAGSAFERSSPLETKSPLFYFDAQGEGELRLRAGLGERAVYVIRGEVLVGGVTLARGQLGRLSDGLDIDLEIPAGSHAVCLGGTPFPEKRFIEWNFVSSRKDRIQRAKDDWRQRRFPVIPTDREEFIPLP